jgi:hypothetical protein
MLAGASGAAVPLPLDAAPDVGSGVLELHPVAATAATPAAEAPNTWRNLRLVTLAFISFSFPSENND